MDMNPRYARHYQLAGFGKDAQEKLGKSSVLVVGAGGLGCPALQYLVASGIAKVGIVDHDTIALDNLQRQVLFATDEIGRPKAEVAAAKLKALNPEVEIRAYVARLATANAIEWIGEYDLVVDCTDNFATRYLLSDGCRLLDKPLVFGAIFRYEGQVAVFNVAGKDGKKTTYRHLFPIPPDAIDAPDCNTAGVLGVLPGTIGMLQATETIKVLTGIGQPLYNRLMTINLLDYTTLILEVPETIDRAIDGIPTSIQEFERLDYETHCTSEKPTGVEVIGSDRFRELAFAEEVLVVDVRNLDEMPRLPSPHLAIPLATLEQHLASIDRQQVVVVCQSGKRSLAAASLLKERLGESYTISHLAGGVTALQQHEQIR